MIKKLFGAAATIAGVASVVVLASVPALAGSVSATYYAGIGDLPSQFWDNVHCNSSNPGVGEICVPGSGATAKIEGKDQTGQPLPMRVFYLDSGHAYINTDADLVCGKGTLTLQDGTAFIEVRVGPLGRGTITVGSTTPPTMACGQPEPVTTGTITVTGDGVGSVSTAEPRAAGAARHVARHFSVASATTAGSAGTRGFRLL